jgi:hypothetical protein
MSGGKNLNSKKVDPSVRVKNKKHSPITPPIVFLLVMLLALVLLVLSFLQTSRIKKQIALSDKVLTEAGLIDSGDQQGAFVELSYPVRVNQGDLVTVQVVTNLAQYTLAEKNDKLVAELLLTLDGSKISPDGESLYPILGQYPVTASWQVIPLLDGNLKGTIWIHLQTLKNSEEVDRYLLMAYPIEIQSVTFLGLDAGYVRIFCIALAVISGLTALALGIRLWVGNIKH